MYHHSSAGFNYSERIGLFVSRYHLHADYSREIYDTKPCSEGIGRALWILPRDPREREHFVCEVRMVDTLQALCLDGPFPCPIN